MAQRVNFGEPCEKVKGKDQWGMEVAYDQIMLGTMVIDVLWPFNFSAIMY
jgi:hypothetical protein